MAFLDPGPSGSAAIDVLSSPASKPPVDTPAPKIPEKGATSPALAPPMTPGAVPDVTKGGKDAFAAIADLEKQRADYKPPKADLPKKVQTPQEGMSMWGAIAIAFAALASRRTRTPMTSALNASAAALKGVQQGNKEAFEQAQKQWEMDTKTAMESYNLQREAYEDVMKNINRREDLVYKAGETEDREAVAKLNALSKSFDDPGMWDAYQRGGFAEVKKFSDARDLQAKKLQETQEMYKPGGIAAAYIGIATKSPEFAAAQKAGDTAAQKKIILDAIHELPPEVLGKLGVKGLPGGRQMAMPTDDELKDSASKIAKYEMTVDEYLKNFPARDGIRAEVNNRVRDAIEKENPDWNPVEGRRVQTAITDLTKGTQAKNITALTQLSQHMETLESLVDALPNEYDEKAFNQIANVWARQNNVDLSKYNTAAEAVNAELVKVLAGSSGGSLTDRERSAVNFDPSLTKEQLRGNIETIKHLAAARINTIQEQYKYVPNIGSYFPERVHKFFETEKGKKAESSKVGDESGTAPEPVSITSGGKGAPPKDAVSMLRAKGPDGQEHTLYKRRDGSFVKEDGTPVE
jgi:hypothetical protein